MATAEPAHRLPRAGLRGVERAAVPIVDAINTVPWVKATTWPIWRYGSKTFVMALSSRLYRLYGLEHIRAIDAPQGVILVPNHRSFFDLFFVASALVDTAPHVAGRMMFPVRKDYFYDRSLGLLLNLGLTAGSMWPPVFRDERRGDFNAIAMAQLGRVMRKGTIAGIHPEGQRGRGDDPYVLGKIRPGLGQVVAAAHPDALILPTWILGMSNDFFGTARRNYRPAGQRGEPVRIWFGAPLRAGDLVARYPDDPLALTQAVMAEVAALGERDRLERMRDPSPA